jgi:CBS domain-containing protein
MLMLTELLRYAVHDERGRSAPVGDLCIALLDDDYPPVTHVHFLEDGKPFRLDWKEVTGLDRRAERINVADLDAARPADEDGDVLLRRDILDALILDLLGRRTTRVCDLRLDLEEDDSLRLKGADAGFGAMIRRITRGRFGKPRKESLFDWKYVEFLRGDPSAVDNGAGYRLRINRLPAGEIARLADYVPYLHAAELLKLLPDEKAADVLQAMSVERQRQVIEELPESEAIELVCLMSPDLATDLVGRLEVDTMRHWLSCMAPRYRERIIQLLRYPENSVGGVMVNDVVMLPAGMTVEESKAAVQRRLGDTHFTSVIFVVDDETNRKLRGAMLLREVLTAQDDRPLDEIMDPYLEPLEPFGSAADAAYRIVGGQLAAMPVVDNEGRLLGAMTVDAAVTQLVPPTSGLQSLRVFS